MEHLLKREKERKKERKQANHILTGLIANLKEHYMKCKVTGPCVQISQKYFIIALRNCNSILIPNDFHDRICELWPAICLKLS